MKTIARIFLVVFIGILMFPAMSFAQTDENAEAVNYGISIDIGLASAYNFRGLNVFGIDQTDQYALFSPSITWSIFDSGFSIGYWGAYQVNGDNLSTNVSAGVGHEQDIIFGYSHSWLDNTLSLDAAFTLFLYPFASKSATATATADGTECPLYIEPSVTLSYSTVLNFSLQVAWFVGIQEAVEDYRYVYVRPYISKSFALTDRVTQTIGIGYGYKLYHDADKMEDNTHDIAFDLELGIAITDSFSITPAIRGGWTNLTASSAGDEYFLLASTNVAFSF